jgi:hypothetical protein
MLNTKKSEFLLGTSIQTQEFYYKFIEENKDMKPNPNILNYIKSFLGALKYTKYWGNSVKKYCMFIGCGRTGHSLIGSLIDAHPDMVMSDELDVLRFIQRGYSKNQIYYMLVKQAKKQAREQREVGGYFYAVPHQWQGKFRKIKVIGDKAAAPTTATLQANPYLFDLLSEKIDTQIKFLHITRNPYDVISTFTIKENVDLITAIELYFLVCKAVQQLKEKIDKKDIFELSHESFINNPKKYLGEICNYLGVNIYDDYLRNCASIVYKSPHQSRHKIEWSDREFALVQKNIDKYSFLSNYSFED